MLENKKQTQKAPQELNELKALAANNIDPALIQKLMELLEIMRHLKAHLGAGKTKLS